MEILFMVCFWLIAICIVFIVVNCVAERKDRKSLDTNLQMIIFENRLAIDTLKNENEALKKDIEHLKNFIYATRNKDK